MSGKRNKKGGRYGKFRERKRFKKSDRLKNRRTKFVNFDVGERFFPISDEMEKK